MLGATDALVTVVAFSDFQSPPAKRAAATLGELLNEYQSDLRVVWKDDPLPFNSRAKPAAVFARRVFNAAGPGKFWRAHDLLFASQPNLQDTDLQQIARQLGLAWSSVDPKDGDTAAVAKVDDNSELARDVQARGTPHFFINGVRLPGAQPATKFRRLIDRALLEAKQLVEKGVDRRRLYEHIVTQGKQLPVPEKKSASKPGGSRPSLGTAGGRVSMQFWMEFPCSSCAKTMFVLYELIQEHPQHLQIIWRSPAEPERKQAFETAQVLHEAFAQKQNTAFWPLHNRLLEAQSVPDSLTEEALKGTASDLNLNAAKLHSAIRQKRHAEVIREDARAAEDAGIRNLPAFTINGYHLSGTPTRSQFRRLIQRALRESR